MHLVKVIAKIVATQKIDKLVGGKLLVVRAIDTDQNVVANEPLYVAVDSVGAGVGDCVLVEWGGSVDSDSRMVGDMSIVGIVDCIEFE